MAQVISQKKHRSKEAHLCEGVRQRHGVNRGNSVRVEVEQRGETRYTKLQHVQWGNATVFSIKVKLCQFLKLNPADIKRITLYASGAKERKELASDQLIHDVVPVSTETAVLHAVFSPALAPSAFSMLTASDKVLNRVHSKRSSSGSKETEEAIVLHRKNTLRVDLDKRKNLVLCGDFGLSFWRDLIRVCHIRHCKFVSTSRTLVISSSRMSRVAAARKADAIEEFAISCYGCHVFRFDKPFQPLRLEDARTQLVESSLFDNFAFTDGDSCSEPIQTFSVRENFETCPQTMKQILLQVVGGKQNECSIQALKTANLIYESDLRALSSSKSVYKSKISTLFCGVRNDQLRAIYFTQLASKSNCRCSHKAAALGLCDIALKSSHRGVSQIVLSSYFKRLLVDQPKDFQLLGVQLLSSIGKVSM